jgi:imidazolonepropionase-like amidohydrolase
MHDELALLVRAGLTPMQALRAATYEPAAYLGALDSLGTIRPGRAADLVLLDRDPLADIRNTRSISAVIARGRVLDRAALLRRVARASSAAPR